MLNKIILGTANFSGNYGFKKIKSPTLKEIKKILSYAKKNGIKNIDTAITYKRVEKKLGYTNIACLNIFTKLPKVPKKIKNISLWIKNQILSSSLRLNKKIYGVYLHNPKDLTSSKGKLIYENLNFLKKKKIIKKIGVSVYNTNELDKILDNYKIDMVQLPLNLFNRSFLYNNYLKKLKKRKIEIHLRSIFLQGILLQDYKNIPNYFSKWIHLFKKYDNWQKKNFISKLQICINFIKSNDYVDNIVIGIESQKQLKELLYCFRVANSNLYPKKIFSKNQNLIDPRLWKAK